MRLLLVGYFYGITSERRLMEEVRMHLAYRWFSRLGFDLAAPTQMAGAALSAIERGQLGYAIITAENQM
jgi:hypothetical protein